MSNTMGPIGVSTPSGQLPSRAVSKDVKALLDELTYFDIKGITQNDVEHLLEIKKQFREVIDFGVNWDAQGKKYLACFTSKDSSKLSPECLNSIPKNIKGHNITIDPVPGPELDDEDISIFMETLSRMGILSKEDMVNITKDEVKTFLTSAKQLLPELGSYGIGWRNGKPCIFLSSYVSLDKVSPQELQNSPKEFKGYPVEVEYHGGIFKAH